MSDDLLREATRALRDDVEVEPPPGAPNVSTMTRARVMRSLHERKRARSARLVTLLPLVAVFVAGSAWAMEAGWIPPLGQVFGIEVESPESPSEPAPAPPPSDAVPRRSAPVEEPASVEEPVQEEAPPDAETSEVPSAPEPEPEPDHAERRSEATKPSPPSSARASGPAASASSGPDRSVARDRYEAAHRAHFVEKDPARALAAWDAYLREVPKAAPSDAAFAVEATYNRALCLIRLGRRAEAKSALTPFAEGRYGAYRQSDARALVDAMGDASPD